MKRYLFILTLALTLSTFSSEKAMSSTMVEIVDFDTQQPTITMQGANVRVTNANGLTLSVYNVAGVCVMQVKVEGADKIFELNLPKGCYILKVGKVVRKVSIK